MQLLTFVLLLLVPSLVLCESSSCSDKPTKENFDFSLYHGHWNILMGSGVATGAKCLEQIIQDESENSSAIIFKVIDRNHTEYISVTYEGVIRKTDIPGKLEFNIVDERWQRDTGYWVLDTDYNNYAVVYTCWRHNPLFHKEHAMVLGRSTSLSDEATAAVNGVLENNNFIPDQLIHVSHSDCTARDVFSVD